MYFKQELGKFGEDRVKEYLNNNDYIILSKNFRCRFGEIDIIARDIEKNEIVFFEVKTRNNSSYGTPAESINKYKKNHIYKTAEYFVHRFHLEQEFMRIDVIEVYMKKDKSFYMNHIKQAFWAYVKKKRLRK